MVRGFRGGCCGMVGGSRSVGGGGYSIVGGNGGFSGGGEAGVHVGKLEVVFGNANLTRKYIPSTQKVGCECQDTVKFINEIPSYVGVFRPSLDTEWLDTPGRSHGVSHNRFQRQLTEFVGRRKYWSFVSHGSAR